MSRHTIREWEKIKGVQILDPDGFDRKDPELMTRTFNEHEFNEGMMGSTVRMRSVTTPTSTDDEQTVEVIERWERKGDGTVEIAYSYDGGKTYKRKGVANELKPLTAKGETDD